MNKVLVIYGRSQLHTIQAPRALDVVREPIVFFRSRSPCASFRACISHMLLLLFFWGVSPQIARMWTYEGNLGMCPFRSLGGSPWDVYERGKRLQRTH